jgi:hypothetical protein
MTALSRLKLPFQRPTFRLRLLRPAFQLARRWKRQVLTLLLLLPSQACHLARLLPSPLAVCHFPPQPQALRLVRLFPFPSQTRRLRLSPRLSRLAHKWRFQVLTLPLVQSPRVSRLVPLLQFLPQT